MSTSDGNTIEEPLTTPDGAVNTGNPYKGLRAFLEADEADFFGRETLIEQLLQRVAGREHLLVVVGPSGSGKTSVVRAGLLPALRRGRIPGSERWLFTEMLPSTSPLKELEI